MAKDYFRDITPPSEPKSYGTVSRSNMSEGPVERSQMTEGMQPGEKSIRNIQISTNRPRSRIGMEEIRETDTDTPRPSRRGARRHLLWGAVALAILVLGTIALIGLRPTTVTVTPRSHTILFDDTAHFVAYPAQIAATGTLSFAIETSTLEDSQVVAAKGTEHAEDRASGSITVFNEYSTQSVRIVKDTRFQAPEGLIYKTPAEIVIPGKKGTTPGQITVTVIAEKAGEQYNVGPVARFTLPGLKTSPDMYAKVHARSTVAMTGGFLGERSATTPGAVDTARAEIRNRLQEKALAAVSARADETTLAFPELSHITFEGLPQAVEEGGVRIRERAHVELALFPADNFAYIVGRSVSADAERGDVILKGGKDFAARADTEPGASFASSPLSYTLRGSAQLIWNVDEQELSTALAGREEAAFQAIVAQFPGIKEAHARIEPFWKDSFPSDPKAIKIKVQEPK